MKLRVPVTRTHRLGTAAALALALAFPATAQETASGTLPESLSQYYATLLVEGEWGAVLNLQRMGLEAIDQGRPEVAARALDAAITRIETIYADSPSAKRARSLWAAEGNKDFKGDPYERAMAYYYRGLLFLADGDYGNARAAFRSAEYQDTITYDEDYAGDFGLMSLLAGWASHCAGDAGMAADLYAQASTQQPAGLAAPTTGSTTLVIVESGTSPVKMAAGNYGEALQFLRGGNPFVAVAADAQQMPLLGDLGWQAGTLGGRRIDTVLNGKASFRSVAEGAGGVGMLGAELALGQGDAGLGGAFAVAGIAAMAISASVKAKADIRYWDNLPDRIYGRFSAGGDVPREVYEHDAGGDAYPVPAPVLDRQAGTCRFVLYRTREPATLRTQAVSNLSDAERRKLYKRNEARDNAFRDEMAALFLSADEVTQ